MRNIIFTIIAVVAFATSAYAQGVCVYPTDTVRINFKRKPAGLLDGNFSVAADRKVQFSQGNLQYTISTDTWRFMTHQYDLVAGGSVGVDHANQDVVSFFGWGTSGWDNNGSSARIAYQPWATSSTDAHYGVALPRAGSETLTGDNANADWGVYNSSSLGSGWRTLTTQEWKYLFEQRTPGNSVNDKSNARYTFATINTDGTAVNGIILFPDDANIGTSIDGITWGIFNGPSSYGVEDPTSTQCTTSGWIVLENAGCVFLPAAGIRDGTNVVIVGTHGYYWSSSAYSATHAHGVYFYSTYCASQSTNYRRCGYAVRLVQDL